MKYAFNAVNANLPYLPNRSSTTAHYNPVPKPLIPDATSAAQKAEHSVPKAHYNKQAHRIPDCIALPEKSAADYPLIDLVA